MGNLFWGTPGQFEQLGPRVADVYIGGAGTAGDLDTPAAQDYANNIIGKWFTTIQAGWGRGAAGVEHVHVRLLREHVGPHQGPRGRQGRHLRPEASCRPRWRRSELPAPYGNDQAGREPPGGPDGLRPAAVQKSGKLAVKTVEGDPRRRPDVRRDVQRPDTPPPGPQVARRARSATCRGSARASPSRSSAARGHDVTDVVTEPSGPILRLRGVGRRFGGLHAVRDVDLDVARGERRAILGPNGAGKTTLFNVISGDIPQTSGTDRVPGLGRRRRPAGRDAPGSGWAGPTRSRGCSSA